MPSLRNLVHDARARVTRAFGRPRPTVAAHRAALAAHHKVVLLGTCLLASCAAVTAVGVWGVTAMRDDHERLARRDSPALALLLQVDRDLYQAELGLERAAAAADPARRKAGSDFFAENVAQSARRFARYQALAGRAPGEAATIAAYGGDRAAWLAAADEVGRPAPAAAPGAAVARAAARFEAMREDVNRLVDDVYQPAIEASGDRAERGARLTCWELLAGLGMAVAAGVVLTRNMARALRAQRQEADAMDAEREEQNRRQTFEARLSRGLEMTQDEPATLRLVEEVIAAAAPGVSAEVLLADSSRAHLHRAAATDAGATGRGGCAVTKPSDCPAVRRGHRLMFASGGAFDACPHLKRRPGGDCSAVCVPVSIMGQAVGVLHATGADGRLPPEGQVLALEQVASKAGERIGMLRAFSRTEAQASSDPLTGLMNRRGLEERVHELTRRQVPFAVAYGDLDHFKVLNDTHGHETGDKALRTFAQVLKASIRPGDLAARWGGEEFVVVFPRASAGDAVAALERVRDALTKALRGAATPAFTVSFGVAQVGDGALFVDALARADESLLRAKRDGRDRTIVLPDIAPPGAAAHGAADAAGAGTAPGAAPADPSAVAA